MRQGLSMRAHGCTPAYGLPRRLVDRGHLGRLDLATGRETFVDGGEVRARRCLDDVGTHRATREHAIVDDDPQRDFAFGVAPFRNGAQLVAHDAGRVPRDAVDAGADSVDRAVAQRASDVGLRRRA